MRIRTMTGLAVVGAAVATATLTATVGLTGAARASGDPEPVVQIVTEREPVDRVDCPERSGTGPAADLRLTGQGR